MSFAATIRGYPVWARPVVGKMKESRAWTRVWCWSARHRLNALRGKLDLWGWLIRLVMEPTTWVVGLCCATDPVNSQWDRKPWFRRERTA